MKIQLNGIIKDYSAQEVKAQVGDLAREFL